MMSWASFSVIQLSAQPESGGVFLNHDWINAPTAELQQQYDHISAARRERAGVSAEDVQRMAGPRDEALSGDTGRTVRTR